MISLRLSNWYDGSQHGKRQLQKRPKILSMYWDHFAKINKRKAVYYYHLCLTNDSYINSIPVSIKKSIYQITQDSVVSRHNNKKSLKNEATRTFEIDKMNPPSLLAYSQFGQMELYCDV
jgi:hypothetical protein